ncbi:MAG: 16S rRNA (guanine(527)-N(7))-methyltransferase RsmG [Elusimicrobiota bacterium]
MIPGSLRAEAAERLARWGAALDPGGWELLDRYLQDVMEYNRKVNLTAARSREELLRRHALDALAALAPLRERFAGKAPSLLDVGAGAGFIGVCLKAAWPEAAVTLLESAYRKVCFLNWTSARLGLKGLRVLHGRADGSGIQLLGASGGKGVFESDRGFDAVLARALAPLPEAVRLSLPLARPGGCGVIYRSARPDPGDEALRAALRGARGVIEETAAYRLPGEDRDRHLVILLRRAT